MLHFLKNPNAQAAFDATYGAGGGMGGNYAVVGLRCLGPVLEMQELHLLWAPPFMSAIDLKISINTLKLED